MTEDEYAIVPHSSDSLLSTSLLEAGVLSSMVEQTLALVKQEGPAGFQGISILFADWDEAFVDFFEEEMKARCGNYPLKVTRCGEAPAIIQAAAAERFDLAIVTLNNVFGIGPGVNDRIRAMLKIIRDLKAAYEMPIIALSGYYDSDDLPDRARDAGANIFRDREDTEDLGSLAQLYLARAKPDISWTR